MCYTVIISCKFLVSTSTTVTSTARYPVLHTSQRLYYYFVVLEQICCSPTVVLLALGCTVVLQYNCSTTAGRVDGVTHKYVGFCTSVIRRSLAISNGLPCGGWTISRKVGRRGNYPWRQSMDGNKHTEKGHYYKSVALESYCLGSRTESHSTTSSNVVLIY
jgi:hypothetical protein